MKVPTEAEIRDYPVTVDIPTAGRCFGLGRDASYELARAGDFPCAVLPLGRRFRVTKVALLAALGYETAEAPAEVQEPKAA